jgi:hypothetical protein
METASLLMVAYYIRGCYDKVDFPTNTPAVSGFFSIERTRNRSIGTDGR